MEEVSLDFGQLGEACSRNMDLLVSEQSSLLEQASKILLLEDQHHKHPTTQIEKKR